MKKNNFFKAVAICTASFVSYHMSGQCPNAANIYTITTNGKKYEVVKQRTNWLSASNCAVQRGGYLVEINSFEEQNTVFSILQSSAAGIDLANTTAPDGGGASYVWLGGMRDQNNWVWNGRNNNNFGNVFWNGGPLTSGGTPAYGAFALWGNNEPDNFQGIQRYLSMALTPWPMGAAGQWNDLNEGNQLYYVIEYSSTLATEDLKSEQKTVQLYPNAVKDFLYIKTGKSITDINITNAAGYPVKSISGICKISDRIDCRSFPKGVYFVELKYTDRTSSRHKFINAGR